MKLSGKKILLILCLASILLLTGAGFSFAAGGSDYGQVIDDLNGLFGKMAKLSPVQAEQAVNITGAMVNDLFNDGVLSEPEKTALKNTLNIDYFTYKEIENALKDYINDYASGGKTGYAGLLNAINPDNRDTDYLLGLVGRLYTALGPETRAQLASKGISFEEMVSIAAKLGQIQFEPGLAITDAVKQQLAAILQELIVKSSLTQDDLTACGLTVENITELYGKLTTDEKAQLEGILTTMGLVSDGNQEKPQVATYQPVNNAPDVALNATVSATFDRDVTVVGDLSGVKIEAGSNALLGTVASLEGRVLTISHPVFQYNTTYKVTIPTGSVQAGNATNNEISWSFTTLQETGEYKLTLGVQYDSNNNKVTVAGSLKKNDETQAPVKDVSIGIVIEKGSDQYAFAQMLTNQQGAFEKTFSTATFEPGTYTVTATANLLTKQGSFIISAPVPVAPTVQTNEATSVTTISATLNGNITNTGGENCDQHKFQYRQQGTTEWADAGLETGSFVTGAFSFNLTGLSSSTAYEAKAMAHNTAGWGEGIVVAFTTTRSSGGGGGGGGGYTPVLEVDTFEPAKDAENVPLEAIVKVTFKQNIKEVDLTKVTVKDDQNKDVGGVKATVSGKALTIAHDKFAYNTKYTVNIPKGTVKRTDNNTENNAISWSFNTLKEAVPPKPECIFTDVPATHWAATYIKALCEKEIIAGYLDGTFKPNNNISRAEFAKIIVGALGLAEVKPATPTFADVPAANWAYGYVEAAAKSGLVKGSDGKFRPNDSISRQEIALILVRAMNKESEALAKAGELTNFKDDAKIAAWAKGHVIIAVAEGLITGYPNNTFGPVKNATRAESAKMVYFFMEKK